LFIKTLKIENIRNLARVDIDPNPTLNVLFGANGAGKTSVLESLVVLSRGRSFRTNQANELIGPEGDSFRVFAELSSQARKPVRLGLERSGKHWRARKDGADLSQLSQLTRDLPLVLMEPNSHLLVSGPPEIRRKYLDWGMFHVEHEFLDTWRRFSKILKQRNAALRFRQEDVLDSIDAVFSELGSRLGRLRRSHSDEISERAQGLLADLGSNLENIRFEYHNGWTKETLQESLLAGREGDLVRGTTGSGPHRADIALFYNEATARSVLSRGEQKLLSAALLLSQVEILAKLGEKPIVLLDDLGSEFDQDHFERVLSRALKSGGQVWVSGTRTHRAEVDHKVFHVEHGVVQEMVQ
jgi:DNA replication and repair protein RecF